MTTGHARVKKAGGAMTAKPSLRLIFSGRRGRLLIALLFAEFGAAVHSIAYSAVLPLASDALDGARLYGATLVSGSFAAIFVLATGLGPFARLSAGKSLLTATALFVFGVGLTAGAVTMWMVLAGMIIRGVAGGLLAGFGLTAIGALYEDDLRPRVVGLFAIIWLVPSLGGPLLNAAVTLAFDWRIAMAWPAALVVLARILIGRHVTMIPWRRSDTAKLEWRLAVGVLAGLVLASTAPASANVLGVIMLVGGIAVASVSSLWIVNRQVRGERARLWTLTALFALSFAFFGGHQVIALAAIDALGQGVVAGSVAVGAGLVTWSLTGMRKGETKTVLGDATVLGLAILTLSLVAVAIVMGRTPSYPVSLVLVIGLWAAAGTGMGLSYRHLFSEAMDNLPADNVTFAAVALSFAELAGTATGTLTSGGIYSLGDSLGTTANNSLSVAYAVLGAAAFACWYLCARRARNRQAGAASGGGS